MNENDEQLESPFLSEEVLSLPPAVPLASKDESDELRPVHAGHTQDDSHGKSVLNASRCSRSVNGSGSRRFSGARIGG